MKTILLALALVSCTLVAAPTALACPDPDNPCDLQPYDPAPTCDGKPLYACVKEGISDLLPG